MEARQHPTQDDLEEMLLDARGWRWRNVRSLGFGFDFWPIEWDLGIHRFDDRFGGSITLAAGPFALRIMYNDGSALKFTPTQKEAD